MHELQELKERLIDYLKEYNKDLTKSDIEMVDTLAHATKNLCKVIEDYEDGEYAERGMSRRGMNYRGRTDGRRDSRGRYSSRDYYDTDEITDKLRDLMDDAQDEKTRMEIQNFIHKMEKM